MEIRTARPADAADIRAIYAPFVEHTAVSFELVAPTVAEVEARIAKACARWQWLVAEDAGRVVGYAYGTGHREREAYRYACEVSLYIAPDHQRRGLGRALYDALLPELAARGACLALAGIAQPNEASVGLHRALGFELVGTYRAIGWKLGRWHDVSWLQRTLRDRPLDG